MRIQQQVRQRHVGRSAHQELVPLQLPAQMFSGAAGPPLDSGAAVLPLLPVCAAGKLCAGLRDPQGGAPAQPHVRPGVPAVRGGRPAGLRHPPQHAAQPAVRLEPHLAGRMPHPDVFHVLPVVAGVHAAVGDGAGPLRRHLQAAALHGHHELLRLPEAARLRAPAQRLHHVGAGGSGRFSEVLRLQRHPALLLRPHGAGPPGLRQYAEEPRGWAGGDCLFRGCGHPRHLLFLREDREGRGASGGGQRGAPEGASHLQHAPDGHRVFLPGGHHHLPVWQPQHSHSNGPQHPDGRRVHPDPRDGQSHHLRRSHQRDPPRPSEDVQAQRKEDRVSEGFFWKTTDAEDIRLGAHKSDSSEVTQYKVFMNQRPPS